MTNNSGNNNANRTTTANQENTSVNMSQNAVDRSVIPYTESEDTLNQILNRNNRGTTSGYAEYSVPEDEMTYTDYAGNAIKKDLNYSGVEGMPYQFHPTVDRRFAGTWKHGAGMGRKYASKIFSRMPLLFLTPCTASFMQGFNASDKGVIASAIFGNENVNSEIIEGTGMYYTGHMAYDEYWEYVNIMLRSVAYFLGINKEPFGPNGSLLENADWAYETNYHYKNFFSSKESVIFYTDALTSVSKSFSNDYGASSIASQINSYSDQLNEIKFLLGSDASIASTVLGAADATTDSIANDVLAGLSGKALGGGIVQSLASDGVNTILNGGKIIFPDIWQDSHFSESYSVDCKFRSPDNDSVSIFLNVIKPYCKLLAFVMPHQDINNTHAYMAPFLCRASARGKFSVELGAISSLNATSGADCQWNDDGLPTQIDVSIDITNLYQSLAMSKSTNLYADVARNTAYMDFLGNMAGLNIVEDVEARAMKMQAYLLAQGTQNIVPAWGTKMSAAASRFIGGIYRRVR